MAKFCAGECRSLCTFFYLLEFIKKNYLGLGILIHLAQPYFMGKFDKFLEILNNTPKKDCLNVCTISQSDRNVNLCGLCERASCSYMPQHFTIRQCYNKKLGYLLLVEFTRHKLNLTFCLYLYNSITVFFSRILVEKVFKD